MAPKTAQAVHQSRPLIEGKYEVYRAYGQDDALPEHESFDLEIDELGKDRFIMGDPDRVDDEVARYRERLGITHLTFRVQWPGMDQDAVLRSIRLLGEHLLPHFGGRDIAGRRR